MKPCWEQQGLGPNSAKLAEAEIENMCALLKRIGNHEGVAKAVLKEACFRQIELPMRTPSFQKKYLRENT
jgi:hypothetical protein